MTTKEILIALYKGKRITATNWSQKKIEYVFYDKDINVFYDEGGIIEDSVLKRVLIQIANFPEKFRIFEYEIIKDKK